MTVTEIAILVLNALGILGIPVTYVTAVDALISCIAPEEVSDQQRLIKFLRMFGAGVSTALFFTIALLLSRQ